MASKLHVGLLELEAEGYDASSTDQHKDFPNEFAEPEDIKPDLTTLISEHLKYVANKSSTPNIQCDASADIKPDPAKLNLNAEEFVPSAMSFRQLIEEEEERKPCIKTLLSENSDNNSNLSPRLSPRDEDLKQGIVSDTSKSILDSEDLKLDSPTHKTKNTVTNSFVNDHTVSNGNVKLKCEPSEYCDINFDQDNIPTVSLHENKKKIKICICRVCNKTYTNVDDLTSHRAHCKKERKFNCTVCDKKFYTHNFLLRHERSESCLEKKALTGDPEQRYLFKKSLHCTVCSKIFSCTVRLKSHMRIHSGERPFSCPICGKTFPYKGTLRVHLRIHSGERPYGCPICGTTFADSSHLARHVKNHSGQKNFECNLCGKKFAQRNGLTIHNRTHTGERPFKCNMCERDFSQRGALVQHQRLHTGEKPFSCDLCEEAFTTGTALADHIKMHNGEKPLTCDICNKTFSNRNILTVHSKIHTGEKPFNCTECDKSFTYRGGLIVHQRIHSGERPFCCPVCFKTFYDYSHFARHKKSHGLENTERNPVESLDMETEA